MWHSLLDNPSFQFIPKLFCEGLQWLLSELWLSQANVNEKIRMGSFFYLSRADFDVEVASFVWDLENFGPGKAIDPETISVDEQAVCTHTKHDLDPFWILVSAQQRIKALQKEQI